MSQSTAAGRGVGSPATSPTELRCDVTRTDPIQRRPTDPTAPSTRHRVVNRRPAAPKKANRAAAAPEATTPRPQRNPRVPTQIVLTTGPLTGTSLPLRDSGVLIGRNPECTLVLDDEFASGRHARILRAEDGWYVEDLGSTNGTFVGQYRVGDPVPVETGTAIRIGRTVIELRS